MSSSNAYPFMIVNAFTTEAFRGNPAAVIFLLDGTQQLQRETLQNIAKNFNQPMTSFITPSISAGTDFDISWCTGSGAEISLCGHGTLAAAKAITTSGLATLDAGLLRFNTPMGATITAEKVEEDDEDEWFEIKLPAAQLNPMSSEEKANISRIIAKAAGRESVHVKFAGIGAGKFSSYVMMELDEQENLAGTTFDAEVFRETGHQTHILTTESSTGNEVHFVRVFDPVNGVNEDHVCGSANCLTGPYWAEKKGHGSTEMKVKQVSPRGGDLRVTWEDAVVKVRGQVRVIAKGEMYL